MGTEQTDQLRRDSEHRGKRHDGRPLGGDAAILIHRMLCYLRFPLYLIRLRSWSNAKWVLDFELNEK